MSSRSLRRSLAVAAVLLCTAGFTGPASAQSTGEMSDVRFEKKKKNAYQIVGRFRTIGVPNFFMNAFYDKHSANWRDGHSNFAYGLEFVWRKVGAFELSVAAEYADLSMPDAWWKEQGKDPSAADYTQFNLGLASLVFSGYWYWDVADWFAPYVGGGLGLGIVTGEVTRYNPRRGTSCRRSLGSGNDDFAGPSCRDADGEVDYENEAKFESIVEDGIWPVAPVINITGGARFNILDHGVVKVEFGFYDYVFAGISLGGEW